MRNCIVTGRWEDVGEELFTLKDRHDKEFVLSPVGNQNYLKVSHICSFFTFCFLYSTVYKEGVEVKG